MVVSATTMAQNVAPLLAAVPRRMACAGRTVVLAPHASAMFTTAQMLLSPWLRILSALTLRASVATALATPVVVRISVLVAPSAIE